MWLSTQTISRRTQRGVAWLDPCGAELEWASIQKLAGTGLFEVVVNFALSMALQRMLPNSGEVPDRWAATLDRYFGSRTWFEQVYQRRQGGLFANRGYEKRPDYSERHIGRAHVCTPVTNAHLVCRLLLEKKKKQKNNPQHITKYKQ